MDLSPEWVEALLTDFTDMEIRFCYMRIEEAIASEAHSREDYA